MHIERVSDQTGFERWAEALSRGVPEYPRAPAHALNDLVEDPEATHFVAVRDGRPVGAATVDRAPWAPEGHMGGSLVVVPDERRRGVGSALLEAVLQRVRERGGTHWEGTTYESQPAGAAFAEHRGFQVAHVGCPVALRLADVDLAALPGDRDGLQVVTAADRPDLVADAHAVDVETSRDVPSPEPEESLGFEDWHRLLLEGPRAMPELCMMALDDDRVVAYAVLGRDLGRPQRAWHQMTAVLRSHRGRRIGERLKSEQIRLAPASGLEELFTINHETNAPMRAINQRLGYQPLPRMVYYRVAV